MDAEIARDEISISPYLGDEMQYEMRLRSVLDRGGGSAKACGITSEDSASRAPVVRYPPLSLTLRLALSLALTLTLNPSLTLSLALSPSVTLTLTLTLARDPTPKVRYRSAVDSALQEQLEQGKGGGHGQVG